MYILAESSARRSFMKGTDAFPIQKCAIFRKFEDISSIALRQPHERRTNDSADLSHPRCDGADLSRSRHGLAEKGILWTEMNLTTDGESTPLA